MSELSKAKEVSIIDYLSRKGYVFLSDGGGRVRTNSPFNIHDETPSFVVYPTNTFKCYSTGEQGDMVDLFMKLEDVSFADALKTLNNTPIKKAKIKPYEKKPFYLELYLTDNNNFKREIKRYAEGRGIKTGYEYGQYYIVDDDDFGKKSSVPVMMFLHRDEDLNVVGCKMRHVRGENQRFTSRGVLNLYIIDHLKKKNTLYIMESETSAISLAQWLYAQDKERGFAVLCFGGVSQYNFIIPEKYIGIRDKRVIIDYDGDKKLFEKRAKKFREFGTVIELPLPKGEDINSLYIKGELNQFKEKLL